VRIRLDLRFIDLTDCMIDPETIKKIQANYPLVRCLI
jgi:hypothetical protein